MGDQLSFEELRDRRPEPPQETLRGLTLWQPWAWAIAHGGKRIENRPWRPWPSIVGELIAIHAAARVDVATEAAAAEWIRQRTGVGVPEAATLPRGAMGQGVARARLSRSGNTGSTTGSTRPQRPRKTR